MNNQSLDYAIQRLKFENHLIQEFIIGWEHFNQEILNNQLIYCSEEFDFLSKDDIILLMNDSSYGANDKATALDCLLFWFNVKDNDNLETKIDKFYHKVAYLKTMETRLLEDPNPKSIDWCIWDRNKSETEGFIAFLNGYKFEDNPHNTEVEYKDWAWGWRAGNCATDTQITTFKYQHSIH